MTDGDIARLAASAELARRLAVQVLVSSTIRAAAERVEAPARLRAALAAERRGGGNPADRLSRSTGMATDTSSFPAAAARRASWARWWLATRVLGALAMLAVGAVHLQQYFKLYSEVPTIGTLFVLNFAGATVIGLGLLAPVDRLARRYGGVAVTLLALAGIGLALTAFVFLAVSEHTPLFGFQEPGYDPPAITAARISEIAAVVLLGVFLVARTRQRRRST